MVQIFANTIILQLLLRKMVNRHIGFLPSLFVGLLAALGMSLLMVVLSDSLGLAGILVAAGMTGVLLGAAISLIFQVGFDRAWPVGAIFALINLVWAVVAGM